MHATKLNRYVKNLSSFLLVSSDDISSYAILNDDSISLALRHSISAFEKVNACVVIIANRK